MNSRPNCDQIEKSLHLELIDAETMSYDANPLMFQVDVNSYSPLTFLDSETIPPEQRDANLSMVSINSEENFEQDNDSDTEWLYIANRDPDVSAGTISRLLQQKFGVKDVKLDVLSLSSSTYRSFIVLVNKSKVKTVLDLENWPNVFYVRRFKLSSDTVFQEAPHKNSKKKHFINNPRNQITRSSTTYVSGIRSQLKEIRSAIAGTNYDIIVLIETWLHEGIFNSEIFDSAWNVYRADRVLITDVTRRGGGALIAIRSNLNSVQIVNYSIDDIDFVFVKLKLDAKWIYLNVTYCIGVL